MTRLSLLALAALVAAPLAQAQPDAEPVMLRPGHPALMTQALTFDSHVESVRVTEPSIQDIGLITHDVSREGDTVTMNVSSNVPAAGDVAETSVVFDATTLAPVSRQRTTRGSSVSTRYDGVHVTGTWSRGEWAPLPFDITLRNPAFAPEAIPLIARALPLEAGYRATAHTFDATDRLREVTLTVIGQEEFMRADGSMTMPYVVEATVVATRGGGTRRYFVDGDTRALVGVSFSPQSGTTVVTEPTSDEALAAMEEANALGEPLRPGSDQLMTDALTSYSQSMTIKLVQPQQQDIGTSTRTLTIDEAAGTATLETTLEIAIAGQRQTETTVVEYPSLRPISSEGDANGTVTSLEYSATGVTGTREPAGDNGDGTIDLSFDEPIFDSSWLFEVVRLLPFEEGYKAAFQTVSTADGETALNLTVMEQEEIDGRMSWKVQAQPEEGPAQVFYVDAETRMLTRIELIPQVGVVIQFVPDSM